MGANGAAFILLGLLINANIFNAGAFQRVDAFAQWRTDLLNPFFNEHGESASEFFSVFVVHFRFAASSLATFNSNSAMRSSDSRCIAMNMRPRSSP